MADDTHTPDDPTDPPPEDPTVTDDSDETVEDAATQGTDSPRGRGADAAGGEPEPNDDVDSDEWRRVLLSQVNSAVLGTLVVHYPERDVTLYCDGDAALRILKILESGRTSPALVDHLDPSAPVADRGWVVLRPDEALAMSWLPMLPKARSKPVAIDPAPMPRP